MVFIPEPKASRNPPVVKHSVEELLRAELARRQWQPIDTAPKDGTRIVVYCSSGTAYVVKWNDKYEEWSIPGSGISGVTHWMPLPDAPAI